MNIGIFFITHFSIGLILAIASGVWLKIYARKMFDDDRTPAVLFSIFSLWSVMIIVALIAMPVNFLTKVVFNKNRRA